MKILTPTDKGFDCDTYKKYFLKYKNLINDDNDFESIINDTLFYAFHTDEGNFVSCAYYYLKEDGKLYLNAFGVRKMHEFNIEALKTMFNWFNCDIYATTPHKTAILCLLRAGFEKINNELYVKKKGD